jgi:hypothetical protein
VGDLQTGRDRARQATAAGWAGSLLRGVASGVGISFKPWPWGGVLCRYTSEKEKKKKNSVDFWQKNISAPECSLIFIIIIFFVSEIIFVLHNRKPQKKFSEEREKFSCFTTENPKKFSEERPKVSFVQTENPKEQRAKRKERAERRESREKKREKNFRKK